jgi:hypothetical protein
MEEQNMKMNSGKSGNRYWMRTVFGGVAAVCLTASVGCSGVAEPVGGAPAAATVRCSPQISGGETAYRAIFFGVGPDTKRIPSIWDSSTEKMRQSKEYSVIVDAAAKEIGAKFPGLFGDFGKLVSIGDPDAVAKAMREGHKAFTTVIQGLPFGGNAGQDIWRDNNLVYRVDAVYQEIRIFHDTENMFDEALAFDKAVAEITQGFDGFDLSLTPTSQLAAL